MLSVKHLNLNLLARLWSAVSYLASSLTLTQAGGKRKSAAIFFSCALVYSLDSSTQKEKRKKRFPPSSSCSSESAVCCACRTPDGSFCACRRIKGCRRHTGRRKLRTCDSSPLPFEHVCEERQRRSHTHVDMDVHELSAHV